MQYTPKVNQKLFNSYDVSSNYSHGYQKKIELTEKIRKQQQNRKLVESLPGHTIWVELWSSRISFLIFIENNRSTKLSIKRLNTIDLTKLSLEVRWREQRKLVKDLYNVIGSGQSLKDHLNYRNSYNSNKEITDLARFFKVLRNFLIHNDSFELTSRITSNIDTGVKKYQAMGKSRFLNYLKERMQKLSATESRDLKEKKSYRK